jgi:hypothetical protein
VIPAGEPKAHAVSQLVGVDLTTATGQAKASRRFSPPIADMTGIGNCEDRSAQVAFVCRRQCDCVHSKNSGRKGPCPGVERVWPFGGERSARSPRQLVRAVSGLRMLPDTVLVGRDLTTAVAGPSHFRIAIGKCEEPGRTANRFAECTPAGKESPARHSSRREAPPDEIRAHRTAIPPVTATGRGCTEAASQPRNPRAASLSFRPACAPRAAASTGHAGPRARA